MKHLAVMQLRFERSIPLWKILVKIFLSSDRQWSSLGFSMLRFCCRMWKIFFSLFSSYFHRLFVKGRLGKTINATPFPLLDYPILFCSFFKKQMDNVNCFFCIFLWDIFCYRLLNFISSCFYNIQMPQSWTYCILLFYSVLSLFLFLLYVLDGIR